MLTRKQTECPEQLEVYKAKLLSSRKEGVDDSVKALSLKVCIQIRMELNCMIQYKWVELHVIFKFYAPMLCEEINFISP